ncbi:Chloride channel protein 2 [Araneus ventricosus]|uniref:Chloride channel protein 2 n=1 Tax=Araneus ventricosus TaxID=182803 RepID=A0A4Y2EYI3_ARAVE|nr:Chloride channel protein 2 [Araneus ventricosus]
MGYEHTLMFGQYREDLGEYARLEASRLKSLEKFRKKEEKRRQKELKPYKNAIHRKLVGLWQNTFARLGEDWFFLAFLGVISSLLSFSMDYAISMCQKSRIWLYRDLTAHPFLQYLAWVTLPMCLILFSAGFVHVTAPQAIGSGIPEMKTILRGVVLKEYLSLRTLISKVIGLTCTLGSGMPLGKEGPFVHISSILATILSKLVTSFKGIHENESRANEMLAAACAVGVACSFAAPIGELLLEDSLVNVWHLGFRGIPLGSSVNKIIPGGYAVERFWKTLLVNVWHLGFQKELPFGSSVNKIIPGGYAVVGAAALSGSVTHTISTSVIVFELTGQMSHILPVILAVLIANGISQALQPSIYDSIIQIKKLPYLPPIVSTSSEAHNVYVADIMVRDVVSVWRGCSYKDLRNILKLKKRLQFFPLVESLESMILLGSIQRIELLRLLELQLGRERRLQEAAKRTQLTESPKTPRAEKKPSRFEVVPVVSSTRPSPKCSPPPSPAATPKSPKKSFLRYSPVNSPYNTITSLDARLKQAFENVFKKPFADPFEKFESSVPSTPVTKRSQQPRILVDMSPEELLAWEEDQLNAVVDFSKCHVDPAPFQLVERTTLIKVHSLFSMLGLNYAYVTAIGRLVGVVALKELRKAIENISSGLFITSSNHFGHNEKSEPPSETQSECEDNLDTGKASAKRRNQEDQHGSNV